MCCAVVLHDTATAARGVTDSQVSTHLLKAKGKLISGVNVSMEFCSLTVSTSPWGRCTFNEGMADSPICSKTVLSTFCSSMCFQQGNGQLTYLLKDSPVKLLPIHGVLLYLPVTGVHYVAVLAAQNEAAAVRDGVCHPQWRAPEASKTPGMLPAMLSEPMIM